jgi:integrase
MIPINPPKTATDLSVLPFAKLLPRSAFVGLLEKLPAEIFPDKRIRRNDLQTTIRAFNEFLVGNGLEKIVPDEKMIVQFGEYLVKNDPQLSPKVATTYVANILKLINALPPSVLQRPLVTIRQYKGLMMGTKYSDLTREQLEWFLHNGRKTDLKNGKPVLSHSPHSFKYRKNIYDHTRRFLDAINKKDVTQITKDDVDQFISIYSAKDKSKTALNLLAEIRPFFWNLEAKGIIQTNPLEGVTSKTSKIDTDYVPPAEMGKLMDQETVDLSDIWDVQTRLMIIGFCYDFALRIGEVCLLKRSDIEFTESGYVSLTLRPEVQKGQNKPTITLHSYFEQTSKLLRRYLALRDKFHYDSDALFISPKTKSFWTTSGAGQNIIRYCESLELQTKGKKIPAPHRFRHSFGTLNVSVLGLKLDVYAIMRRLRHTSHELTTRIYITENQELSLMKHEAKMEELRAERRQATSCLPIQKAKISSIASPSIQFAAYISEQDAIQRLNPLEITVRGLQKYGEQSGIIKTLKGKRTYDQHSIEDLANNYFTKKEAMNFLKLKKSGFFYWLQNHGIQAVIIGKISLFRREEIINKGRERKSA